MWRWTRWEILLAVTITAANEQERAQVDQLCQQVQEATEQQVKEAFVDQGYTGHNAAQAHAIDLVVVKLADAKRLCAAAFAGWSNAPSPGSDASAAWPATTTGPLRI
jgi:hypothetical protein